MSRTKQLIQALELQKLDLHIQLSTMEDDGYQVGDRSEILRYDMMAAEYERVCADLEALQTAKVA